MKKHSIYLLIISFYLATSCSKKQADDTLSGHLLMGPFTTMIVSGNVMTEKLDSFSEVSEEELQGQYKLLFALPYSPAVGEQAKSILMNEYQATDKLAVDAAISKLLSKSKTSEFKAYEYACAVNVANMAYSAGYLSKEEVASYEQKILVDAKANYKNWKDYLQDFLSGRDKNEIHKTDVSQPLFEAAVNNILLDNNNSPYITLDFPKL